MKRHPALEPFSRDHNDGLILARMLEEDRPGAMEEFRQAWSEELEDHFAEEEKLLGPCCTKDEMDQLMAEHESIRRAAFCETPDPKLVGRLLHDHIRWEERVLFPALESRMTASEFERLDQETRKLEMRRWQSDASRERLVRRRWGV